MSSIYDLLPEGQQNAISRRELIALTGMSDRALRKAIADERRAGALSCPAWNMAAAAIFDRRRGTPESFGAISLP